MAHKRTTITVNALYQKCGNQISDCTNGGVTSTNDYFVLVPEGVEIPTESRWPVLKVIRRNIGGRDYLHAEPVTPPGPNRTPYMFGGNYVTTSDSRYREWVCDYPIAVHDRSETWEQYDRLSR